MKLAIGRATAGASMATPTKMRTAPRPTSAMAGAVSPQARRATPSTVMMPPRVKRRRKGTSSSVCWADTAATGAIRTARRAGLMAATSVTPTPTTMHTMTVRASNTRGPDGSVTPKPLSSFSRPMAASTPRPRPISDETSPTMAASPRTERKTWRRLAPTMRRSASSRVRWPTVMEKVFKMVKPPTKSAMKAKTSRAVLRKPSAWPMALVASLTTVWPVTTSTPRGNARAMSRCTVALSAPGCATTSIASNWPTSPRSAWAVGVSKAARVAPARLSAVPKRARPTMVNVRVGPCNRIRTGWPTLKSYFCAVPRSMTTWLGVVGSLPWTSRSAEICWSGSKERPRVGAPPVEMALPSGAMYWA